MRIWKTCFHHSLYLTTLYVPSKLNPADAPSRQLHQEIEWSLPRKTFNWINHLWGPHHIDLFASHQNHQLPLYVTHQFHPQATWINAFSRNWTKIPAKNSNVINTQLANCSVVSSPSTINSPESFASAASSTNTSSSKPITPQKRPLDNAGVEYPTSKNKRHKSTKLTDLANNIISSKRYSKTYNYRFKAFQAWYEENHFDFDNHPHITFINYMAYLYFNNQLKISSLITYSSSIMNMLPIYTQTYIKSRREYIDFIKGLKNRNIKPPTQWDYDISPALQHIKNLGNNSTLQLLDLTKKTIWLLAMSGFLRPSDIARIDLDQVRFNNLDIITLLIIAPKEKRGGSHITRTVTIQPNSDPLLCPVAAFKQYYSIIKSIHCYQPHPIIPDNNINMVFRSSRNINQALTVQRIAKHISFYMSMVSRSKNAPLPKARALASTLAAQAGVPIDDIVAHGSWSSKAIFEQFYRISSVTATNFTDITLNKQPLSQTKCNIM
ncbi:hypothetical protein BJ944DRAFT_171258 [Cunninghamella echinulata]|nr:hypothetical protein BJ944DRAFT_171258 [Cunninghamella echinulata]